MAFFCRSVEAVEKSVRVGICSIHEVFGRHYHYRIIIYIYIYTCFQIIELDMAFKGQGIGLKISQTPCDLPRLANGPEHLLRSTPGVQRRRAIFGRTQHAVACHPCCRLCHSNTPQFCRHRFGARKTGGLLVRQ